MNRIYQHLSLVIFLMTFTACSEEVNHEDLLLKAVNNGLQLTIKLLAPAETVC